MKIIIYNYIFIGLIKIRKSYLFHGLVELFTRFVIARKTTSWQHLEITLKNSQFHTNVATSSQTSNISFLFSASFRSVCSV